MEELRPLLTVYAYNILGSWEEAKDAVLDVFVKFLQLDASRIQDQKPYLIRMVINEAIDQKERQKKILHDYPGYWLPEAVATEGADTAMFRHEILSYSLMVLLEKLDARQRAVFILKEAFDYDHEEIGALLNISTDNSRQILSRAKSALHADAAPATVSRDWLDRYLAVMESGDMDRVTELLHHDVSVVSDGGGKASAFRRMVHGLHDVAALLNGLHKKTYQQTVTRLVQVNHQPALAMYHDNKLVTCQIFSLQNGAIDKVYFIRNPDKLKNLEKSF